MALLVTVLRLANAVQGGQLSGTETSMELMNFLYYQTCDASLDDILKSFSPSELDDLSMTIQCLIVAQRLPADLEDHTKIARVQDLLQRLAKHGCKEPVTQLDDGRICHDAAGESVLVLPTASCCLSESLRGLLIHM